MQQHALELAALALALALGGVATVLFHVARCPVRTTLEQAESIRRSCATYVDQLLDAGSRVGRLNQRLAAERSRLEGSGKRKRLVAADPEDESAAGEGAAGENAELERWIAANSGGGPF